MHRVVDASLYPEIPRIHFKSRSIHARMRVFVLHAGHHTSFPQDVLKTNMMVSGRAVATALCALGTTSAFTGPLAAGSFRAVSVRCVDDVQLQFKDRHVLLVCHPDR